MVTDISRKLREENAMGLLDIKRDVGGNVVWTGVGSVSIDGTPATGTTTLTIGSPVLATSISVTTTGGTNFDGTVLRNGSTLTSGTGVTTLTTSGVLDAPADAPVNFTLKVPSTSGTPTVSMSVQKAQRIA